MFDSLGALDRWPSQASHIMQNCGEAALRAIHGQMDVCVVCREPFRRMSDRKICGACFPRRPLVDAAESA